MQLSQAPGRTRGRGAATTPAARTPRGSGSASSITCPQSGEVMVCMLWLPALCMSWSVQVKAVAVHRVPPALRVVIEGALPAAVCRACCCQCMLRVSGSASNITCRQSGERRCCACCGLLPVLGLLGFSSGCAAVHGVPPAVRVVRLWWACCGCCACCGQRMPHGSGSSSSTTCLGRGEEGAM